ncbi:MAG: alpha/beta fold hydrolase, partial [Sediminibacterium sp.]
MQRILLLCFFLSASVSIFAQVPYGSNNGKYIQHRGFKMYYEVYGKGEPLLIIHGNGGSISNFENQIPYFSKN